MDRPTLTPKFQEKMRREQEAVDAINAAADQPVVAETCADCGHDDRSKAARMYGCSEDIEGGYCNCQNQFHRKRALPPYTTAQPVSAPTTEAPWTDSMGHVWEIRQGVTCVECPHCCFTFDAIHTVQIGENNRRGYDCPNCNGCPDAANLSSTPSDLSRGASTETAETQYHPTGDAFGSTPSVGDAIAEVKRLRDEWRTDLNATNEKECEQHCSDAAVRAAAAAIQERFLPDHRTAAGVSVVREEIAVIITSHLTARTGEEK